MTLPFNFKNIFISIPLNTSNIELEEEDSDIDESKNFNVDIQMYLIFEKEYKKFIVIKVNLNTAKNDSEEYLYKENDFYLKSNNVGYDDII